MKKRTTHIIVLLSVLVGFGCEKEIPFDAEVTTPKLVINGLFNADSLWTVHVSRSLSVIDTGDLANVDDADVRIYDGAGTEVAVLHFVDEGIYQAATEVPLPDETYRITASAPGFADVEATDAIPGAVQIIGLDTNTTINQDSQTVLEMKLTFQDPGGVENFFMVEMNLAVAFFNGTDTSYWEFPARLNCVDPNIETENSFDFGGFENTYEYILLRDNNIDGQTYTLEFSVINWQRDENIDVKASVNLIASSEAFFNYRRSYAAYLNSNGNPFAQPVQVYSNVIGGLGIFAGGVTESWEVEF